MVDYDNNLQYHSGKIMIVPDALSRKFMVIFLTQLKELLEKIRQLNLYITFPGIETHMTAFQLQPPFFEKTK